MEKHGFGAALELLLCGRTVARINWDEGRCLRFELYCENQQGDTIWDQSSKGVKIWHPEQADLLARDWVLASRDEMTPGV